MDPVLYLDAVEHFGRKDVHSRVDLVGDELLGLFHEALDLAGLLVVDHHAVLARLVDFRHLLEEISLLISK